MSPSYVFLFILLIAFLIIIIQLFSKTKRGEIPKIIWTYWNDVDNIPLVVKKCLKTWKDNNPDYKIYIVDYKTLKSFLSQIDIDKYYPHINIDNLHKENNHQRVADFARVLLLYIYGGIWMDASIICTESLEWVHAIQKKTDAEVVGFSSPDTTNINYPILENWFFACIPKSTYIRDWLIEISYMTSFKDEMKYVKYVKNSKKCDMQNLEQALPYLVMHLCATVVHQKNPRKYNIYMISSSDGPFKYLYKNEWDAEKGLTALCNNANEYNYPIIKFRGGERNFVASNRFDCQNGNKFIHFVFS